MKIRNYLILLLFMLAFIPAFINAQENETCDQDRITIQSITLDSLSGSVTQESDPVSTGNRISIDVSMSEPGDNINYKIIVKNDSNKDYEFNSDSININSNYIEYSISSNNTNNIIKPNESKEFTLTVLYKNEVPDTAYTDGVFEDNKNIELVLSTDTNETNTDNETTPTVTPSNNDNVKNPKTGVDATLLFLIVVLFFSAFAYLIINKSKLIKHFVILFALLLIVPVSIYAACQYTINIESKITIKQPYRIKSVSDLKNVTVTSGSGLYKKDNTYIYRGKDPNNYIKIDNDLYRIISIQPDNSLKVIRLNSIGVLPFDPGYTDNINGITTTNELIGTRYGSSSSDICYTATSNNYFGCKVWSNKEYTYKKVNNSYSGIITFPKIIDSTTTHNLPTSESYLAVYLNGGMYNGVEIQGWITSFTDKTQSIISNDKNHNIGLLNYNEGQTIATDISQEEEYKWNGSVGLMNPSDFVNASTNTECNGVYSYTSNTSCYNNSSEHNYLATTFHEWTINPVSASSNSKVWSINPNNSLDNTSNANSKYEVRPVMYLENSFTIDGKGTRNDPYTITITDHDVWK